MHHHPMPDPRYFRHILQYDSETGLITWTENANATYPDRITGALVCTQDIKGYNTRNFPELGRRYRSGRIAWFMHTGDDPAEFEIDHWDRDKKNDKFSNLRKVTRSINQVNTVTNRNKCGIRGVWQLSNGKWGAKLKRGDYCRTLGQAYPTMEAAAAARYKAEEAFYEEYGVPLERRTPAEAGV